jgi:hypothetical protein
MDGCGLVLMDINVNSDIVYLRDMYSNRINRRLSQLLMMKKVN